MALQNASCSFPDTVYSSTNKPSAVTLKNDITILEDAVNNHASNAIDLTSSQTLTNKTFTSPNLIGTPVIESPTFTTNWDGWVNVSYAPNATPWTTAYASATSFSVVGDVSGIIQAGDKIKLTNSTVKYFEVHSVTVSTNTTVNVVGTVDLTNTTISDVYYSKVANPDGFPDFRLCFFYATAPGSQALADGVDSSVVLTPIYVGMGSFGSYAWTVPVSGYYSIEGAITVTETAYTLEELTFSIAIDGVSTVYVQDTNSMRVIGGGAVSVGYTVNLSIPTTQFLTKGKAISLRATANTTGTPGISPTVSMAILRACLIIPRLS